MSEWHPDWAYVRWKKHGNDIELVGHSGYSFSHRNVDIIVLTGSQLQLIAASQESEGKVTCPETALKILSEEPDNVLRKAFSMVCEATGSNESEWITKAIEYYEPTDSK